MINRKKHIQGPFRRTKEGKFLIDKVADLKAERLTVLKRQFGQVIGLEWDQGNDNWNWIDENGNYTTMYRSDFDSIYPWAAIRRVNLAVDGSINASWDGEDYAHDGTNGRCMVEIPRFYVKSTNPSANIYRWWVAPYQVEGFEIHPAFNQRISSPPADDIYVGAYEGDFIYDAGNTQYEMHSRTGKQPWTGDQIWEVDFDAGANEPNIGDSCSTVTEAGWLVVDYNVTSGGWGTNDASGKLWLRKPGDTTVGWTDNETITNDTQANTLGDCEFTGGAKAALHLDIEEVRTYAENIGTGWGLVNIWTHSAILLLALIEYGSMDLQSLLGRGIVDKAGGTGFNGELTGYGSIDSNLGENGTILDTFGGAAGQGNDGAYPICWRFLENIWGNVWEFTDGYEAVDAEYRVLLRDGGWSNIGPAAWGVSDYETSTASPITSDGYISNIVHETLLKYLLIPAATSGSSSTYVPDKFWGHDGGENNILLGGGDWRAGAAAGLGCLHSNFGVGNSHRSLGARLEFIG